MVIVDGIGYDIDVLHLKRTADFLDKYAERTESGDLKRCPSTSKQSKEDKPK